MRAGSDDGDDARRAAAWEMLWRRLLRVPAEEAGEATPTAEAEPEDQIAA